MSYTKEQSFNFYCDKYLVDTNDKTLFKSRNDIFQHYNKWFHSDENITDYKYLEWRTSFRNECNSSKTLKLEKKMHKSSKIGAPEFYQMLENKYGIPPLIRKSDKQLKYKLTIGDMRLTHDIENIV